ncbi:hypothetical protein [Mastigocoleus testarum]|uniref:Uncharacterized protein n=1 Tax=Mastigocoleus testarum BC008 TaxID=371196 RepID=A0A0V7ZC39_9CYAN|nr:hypothetical protein [Mastigocoleus testarum]KST62072.1 hypothetical protein BC008_08555 [Mastigocoleus testarum BC008]
MFKTEVWQVENLANLLSGEKTNNLPEILRGIFFMDGNPLPDDFIKFDGAAWDETSKVLKLPVFAPLQWTFANSNSGRLLFYSAKLTNTIYEIHFDDSLKSAQIIPIILGLRVPKWLFEFSLVQIDEKTWDRKNSWFGGLFDNFGYTLRKILDENGQPTSEFAGVQSKIPQEFLVATKD